MVLENVYHNNFVNSKINSNLRSIGREKILLKTMHQSSDWNVILKTYLGELGIRAL